MYPPSFLDHLARPRSPGRLEGATHRGRAEEHACGDVLSLDLRVEGGRIAEARFRAEGCPGVLAVGSALASVLPGRAATASAATAAEVDATLGGVPVAKRHALRLAVAALSDAFARERPGSDPPAPRGDAPGPR
jgi:NifU-like protein involved in Fe-S cluster formation